MAVQSFRANLVAGTNELSTPTPPYASATYAQITAANATLGVDRWERIYSATPTLDNSLKIMGEFAGYKPEGSSKEYYSGRKKGARNYRRVWELESQPIQYMPIAKPDWDADDLQSFVEEILTAPNLWLNLETPRVTGSSEYYPVYVEDWQLVHDPETGTKTLQLTLAHEWLNL